NISDPEWAKREGMVAFAGYPLLLENRVLGVMALFARHPLSETVLNELALVADGIAQWVQRKQAEEALRESEELFRVMANAMPQLAWKAQPDGFITWYNQGWYEYTGTTPAQMEGWGWQSVHDPAVLPKVLERWKSSIATGERFDMTFPIRGADGVFRPFLTRVVPQKDQQGRVLQWFGTNTDIDDQKRAEEKLERTVRERTADLKETNEQLEAYVYSIAHDLRAPLRSMQGFSQVLIDNYATSLDETARGFLERINRSSEFMDKMIMDLLSFGRAGRAEVELKPVSVQAAWDAALFQCSKQIEQTEAQIETATPLPSVCANEATLTQIFANLLSNGMKFTPQDVQPKIRFWAEDCGPAVRLWIEDNGVGIPPEQHERIFRVFERLNGARFPGTGIGLSIVRKGVNRMDGKVGLESAPGKGTRFWIELQKA
ncbi:MAG: PAS domain-containing sensor histidine kinase, partial [Verrucomicrobiota bacterium]